MWTSYSSKSKNHILRFTNFLYSMIFLPLHALDITLEEKKTQTMKPDKPVRETSSLYQHFCSLMQLSSGLQTLKWECVAHGVVN